MHGGRIAAGMAALLSASSGAAALFGAAPIAAALAGLGVAAALVAAFGFREPSPDRMSAVPPRPAPAPEPAPVEAQAEPEPAPPPLDLAPLDDARRRLAFATAIASSVPRWTEEAAFALIERFESMRGNTSRVSSSAREFKKTLRGGLGTAHATVAEQADRTRAVIKAQRDAIAAMTAHNRQGAKDLRSMGKELESGMDLLKGIEEITERSRLIAFNMAVEAARIGEKGRGFRVIVGELRSLNDRTADFSHQVVELLGRFRDYNATIVARLAEETEDVAHQVQGGMEAAEGAVESLIGASASADSFAREIASVAEVIDGDLDGVLESLQFQDITRQMIEGAVAIFDEALADLALIAGAAGLPESAMNDTKKLEALRRELFARSKTKGEKDAIMEVKR